MSKKELAIGVDLGGTHLRVALIDQEGNVVRKEKVVVGVTRDLHPFFERISHSIRKVAGELLSQVMGIGLGLPGICDQGKGIVYQLPHYPEWKDVLARDLLKKSFSCPILIDNDANMAAIGEHWLGAAKEFSSFMMLTLGTGIGAGLFLNGKLWRGTSGFAGEVGHMTIEVEGKPCPCGKRGCWEMYAASHAVPSGMDAKTLNQLADKGDSQAKDFWKSYGRYLGLGIANLANIVDTEFFVLAGGIGEASHHFLVSCEEAIQEGTYRELAKKIVVRPSSLRDEANLFGCAALCFSSGSS